MTDKNSALNTQVGGDHYKKMKIQPIRYSMANNLNACQHTAIKYISRYKTKDGKQDLLKAIHAIEILIEEEYGDEGVDTTGFGMAPDKKEGVTLTFDPTHSLQYAASEDMARARKASKRSEAMRKAWAKRKALAETIFKTGKQIMTKIDKIKTKKTKTKAKRK